MPTKPAAAAIEPRLLDTRAICIKLSCSKPLLDRYFENGTLDFIMQGRRRFCTAEMIEECIQRLAAMGKPKPSEAVNNRWRPNKKEGASVKVTRAEIDAALKPAKKAAKRAA
jgi:hypothetical protein